MTGEQRHGTWRGVHRGMDEYRERAARIVQPSYAELVENPVPGAIFITCADARVMPNLLTTSGPGDLFTIRNVGNLIPRGDDADASVSGALEYAVDMLGVPELVICGHSRCGAMRALSGGVDPDHEFLRRWLLAAGPTARRWERDRTLGNAGLVDERPEVDQLSMTNVLQQLDNAMDLPFIRSAVEAGRLRITGAFFDVASAELSIYDPDTGRFDPGSSDRSSRLTG